MDKPDHNTNGLRHRNLPSTTSNHPQDTLTSIAQTIESKVADTLSLIPWDELPHWRRDNAYIHTGYRQSHGSYAHSLRSLFYLHNESVNIWTHLLGAAFASGLSLYCLYHWSVEPRVATAEWTDVLVFGCFAAGAIVCLGMSAVFHATSNHSEEVMKWGNKLDYTGIVALIVGSYMPALYYGLFCEPELMSAYMTLICTLGAGCGIVSWVEKFRTPELRPYRAAMFIALGLSGVIPVLHGLSIYGRQSLEDRMSISWVVLHGAMYIFGAVLYAARWPERSFPGSFDIWGSSHQIFHVFVLLAAATHLYGMTKAFDYHHASLRTYGVEKFCSM